MRNGREGIAFNGDLIDGRWSYYGVRSIYEQEKLIVCNFGF